MKPSIYYTCHLPVKAGGELVNFQHVAALRQQGWRAFVLLDDQSRIQIPSQPYPVPMVQLGASMRWSAQDVLVLPEVTPTPNWQQLRAWPCRKVMHNQNPFYTFQSFPCVADIDRYGLLGGLSCSNYTTQLLQRLGSNLPWQTVHPFVLPFFEQSDPAVRKRQIAFMPRKRPTEAALLRHLFINKYPQWANVPWVEIRDMGRRQVAQVLGESLLFASFSHIEGLGLPPLEAMAAGCLVCGFDGWGGREYATPDNGRWVTDGDLESFADALAATLAQTDAQNMLQRQAGRSTAAQFSEARFQTQLHQAWHTLLGADAPLYKTHTDESWPNHLTQE